MSHDAGLQLIQVLPSLRVVARALPNDKSRLVKIGQQSSRLDADSATDVSDKSGHSSDRLPLFGRARDSAIGGTGVRIVGMTGNRFEHVGFVHTCAQVME